MPAPGSVWAAGTWHVDAWAADTWADAEAVAVTNGGLTGLSGLSGAWPDDAVFLALLICHGWGGFV
jgi:hypothetical protein